MTAKEFFFLVASMRDAQRRYFSSRDQVVLRAARKLENLVDEEIARVMDILRAQERAEDTPPAEEHAADDALDSATYSVYPIIDGCSRESCFTGDRVACVAYVTARKQKNPAFECVVLMDNTDGLER